MEDYSYLISALTDLYECTFDVNYLQKAIRFNNDALNKFYDKENGGFFDVDPTVSDIIFNTKEIYDGAEPSGNSVQIHNLLRLGALTDNKVFKDIAEKSLMLFSEDLRRMPFSSPSMLSTLSFFLNDTMEIIISGDPADERFKELSKFVRSIYLPQSVLMSSSEGMKELFPFIGNLIEEKNEPLVYVCRNYACSLPTKDKGKIKELLS